MGLSRLGRRSLAAAAVAASGLAWTYANDYWWAHFSSQAHQGDAIGTSLWGSVFVAAPFLLISILVLFGVFGRIGAALAVVLLGLLVSFGFQSAMTSTSSLSALALLVPWIYGIPGVCVIAFLDWLSRATRDHWKNGNTPAAV